jgi:NAD(P)-dependent dehydrogenase (short-subunit alcohol dehydrogenase family)
MRSWRTSTRPKGISTVARLAGKAALITGAGSGIGRPVAQRISEEGAAVMVAEVVADRAAETAATIASSAGGGRRPDIRHLEP